MASYYEILEVDERATHDQIKVAYRRMARRLHPDRNPEDARAAERFRAVVEAWSVLGDAESRARYDQLGLLPRGALYGTPVVIEPGERVMRIVRNVAQAAGRALRAERGRDVELRVELSFAEAALGVTRVFELPRAEDPKADEPKVVLRRFEFPLPPGVRDQEVLRWRGEGGPGRLGGRSGDLVVRVQVRPDPLLRREGRDVAATLPLGPFELITGTTCEVWCVDGAARLVVPPGTRPGDRLRLRGRGVAMPDGTRGDAVFHVELELPTELDAVQRSALDALERSLRVEQLPRRAAWQREIAVRRGAGRRE